MLSATKISKQLGEYTSRVKNGLVDKIGLEYEGMARAMETLNT
ncbi:hypothetical protein MNB_SV-13-1917 [hydrothermal vent metagenome]|uniref:Uncharacterized protein n=1 Tax=hydrothermal vent metagenome TaxID=652676 RepID=A0A1W1BV96_9ZZZZ